MALGRYQESSGMSVEREQQQRLAAVMRVVVLRETLAWLAERVRECLRVLRPMVEMIRAAAPGDPFWVARLEGRR